jgi:hypothetical protein
MGLPAGALVKAIAQPVRLQGRTRRLAARRARARRPARVARISMREAITILQRARLREGPPRAERYSEQLVCEHANLTCFVTHHCDLRHRHVGAGHIERQDWLG